MERDKGKILARPQVQLLLIILLGVIAYANTFHVPFFFDDESSITDNPVLYNLHSFLTAEGYAYNPRRFIGYLTLALNYHFGGLDVTGYHVVNLCIHIGSALLIYALAWLTLRTPFLQEGKVSEQKAAVDPETWIPLFAALFFVAHPIQTQAVTYIVQRFASLVAMFYLASVACYAKARLTHEKSALKAALPYYLLSGLAALLAIRTKENAATLPFVIFCYEFSFFTRNRRKKLMVIVPVLLLMAIIIPVGLASAGKPLGQLLSDMNAMSRETTSISRGSYLVTQFCVIVTYLRLLILPVGQNLDYDYPLYHNLFQARPILSLLLLMTIAASSAYCYLRTRRGAGDSGREPYLRLVGFGILWFFITMSVESSIIPIRDVIFEHRLYLSSFGVFLAVATLLHLATRKVAARGVAAVAAVAVLAYAGATFARNAVWRDEITLWTDVAQKSPAKARPEHNLGRAYKEAGMPEQAIVHYQQALQRDATNSETYTNLGVLYRQAGRLEEAAAMQRKAIEWGANNPSPRLNLGVLYGSQGRYREAEELFREALRLNPRYADAHYNLGVLYKLQGDLRRAETEFLAAQSIDPLSKASRELAMMPKLR